MPTPPPLYAAPRPDPPAALPRVLVVDDDAAMRAYVCECLEDLRVRVAEAADGQDALDRVAAWREGDLALVVTDVVMPRLDGWALRAALHADRRWTDVPVLLITGEAVRSRDGPVLRKPFNARRLGTSVRSLLDL